MKFEDLEKRFTSPVVLGNYYESTRIPRKLKKKVKKYCGVHWNNPTNGQRLWYYLDKINPDFKRFLIKLVCK